LACKVKNARRAPAAIGAPCRNRPGEHQVVVLARADCRSSAIPAGSSQDCIGLRAELYWVVADA
jgi:hypothetical protein